MQEEPRKRSFFCVEQGGSAFYAVDFIAFFKQELGEAGTVLASDAGDQGFFLNLQISW